MKNIFENVPFILYCLLLFTIGIRTSLAIPYDMSVMLEKYKIIILLLFLLSLSGRWLLNRKKRSVQLFFVSSIFPIYYMLINIFFKEDISFYTIGLYFIWMFYVFLLGQNFIRNEKKLHKYFFYTIIAASAVLLWGGYSTLMGMFNDTFLDRFSMGYENPNYYAQYWQILLISIVFLFKGMNNYSKFISLIIMASAIYFVVLAQSRNVIVWMFVFVYWYSSYRIPGKNLLKIFTLVAIILMYSTLSYEEANSLSSGRILLWEYKIKEMVNQTPWTVFFGAQDAIATGDLIKTYSRLGEDAAFTKLHADNSYLELYMEGGVIGMILFCAPYYYVYKSLGFVDYQTKRLYLSIYTGFIVQSLFITTITSFFSPLVMFMSIILIVPYVKYRNSVLR